MIKIEKMTIEDFYSIENILQTEFDEFWTPSILKSELENDLSKYIVAKDENQIVGFAGIIILPDDVEITNIVTKKNERKKGIGNLLLDKLIQMAFKLEKDISLEVNEVNTAAINLYKKHGFYQIGLRKEYYSDNLEDALTMVKML